MINNNGGQHTVLDRITRITPTMRGLAIVVSRRRSWRYARLAYRRGPHHVREP